MLQFITNGSSSEEIISQVKQVLAGGCKWIQLRMKDFPKDEIISTANAIKPLCKDSEAILVIDDYVEIAKELQLDGVHLGKNDMNTREAREFLGEEFIIGATANTLDDILCQSPLYVDYIGLGPYRFTQTKKNLSPILGLDGYSHILEDFSKTGRNMPIVAIGGIGFDDIEPLMATGISGIAVSGAITNAQDSSAETSKMIDLLNQIIEKRLKEKGII